MYAALWRTLPGPWWVRMLILLVAAATVLYGLFWWVFPCGSPLISPGDVGIIVPSPTGGAR